LVSGYCFGQDPASAFAQRLTEFNLATYGLVVLPALAGAFIGGPLIAREVENGTYRLAWTQGVTRLHWLLVKLVLVFSPLLALAAVVGLLETELISRMGSQPNYWAFFDQQAPLTVASTLFALSLGVAAGALVKQSIPAMAVTLVAFCVARIGLAELARPIYMSPLTYTSHDLANFSSPPAADPGAWWVDQASFFSASGQQMTNTAADGPGVQVAYAIQHFQPADRFWAFQSIESAILAGLALILIGFSIYWVTRRLS
jgi:ABC-type transport system involved in multi-copper enzyme maturation permease subunit